MASGVVVFHIRSSSHPDEILLKLRHYVTKFSPSANIAGDQKESER